MSELTRLRQTMTALRIDAGEYLLKPLIHTMWLASLDEYGRLHYLHGTRNKVLFITTMVLLVAAIYWGAT